MVRQKPLVNVGNGVSGAVWGEFATRPRTKKGQPAAGYPSARYGLLVEAAAEPVLHPAGERSAGALGALLA
jgi:hypothetical protein